MANDFFALLRAGISGSAVAELSDNVDWASIEELGVRQGVLPLLFDGYKKFFELVQNSSKVQNGSKLNDIEREALNKFKPLPTERMLQWYAMTQQAEKHYNEHLTAIQSLTKYLAENGIRTMILKGYSLSLCYPEPSHRPCGDVDIYQFGDFKKADALIEKEGIEIDRSHHHHTVYTWKGVMVENHYDFINLYAHNTSKWLDAEFKRLAVKSDEMVENVVIPEATLHAVFLIRHSGGHFSTTKITLRHLIDWWAFCKKYGKQVDWDYVRMCTDKVGMTEFHQCMDYCVKRMMEDGEGVKYDERTERMWNDIIQPEFNEREPKGLMKYVFMWRRWWTNRWKHKLVFKENLVQQLVALIYTHGLNPEKMLED